MWPKSSESEMERVLAIHAQDAIMQEPWAVNEVAATISSAKAGEGGTQQ